MFFYTVQLIVFARPAITISSFFVIFPRGALFAFSLFAAVWSLHVEFGGVMKQGQISPSANDSQQEGTSWPDEEEPFICWAINETLYPPILP